MTAPKSQIQNHPRRSEAAGLNLEQKESLDRREHCGTCARSTVVSITRVLCLLVFHFNSVSLEPPADADDDDEITARGFLDPFDPGPFEFGSTSRMMGAQRRERDEKKGVGKVLHGSKVGAVQYVGFTHKHKIVQLL